MSDECLFCKGKPVHNAASWIALDVPRYAPCPRCGREWSDDELAEYERARQREVES